MDRFFSKTRGEQISTALLVLLIILSVFFVIKTIGEMKETGQIGISPEARPTITVMGQGEVKQTPDIASFSFSVSAQEREVEAAQNEVTEKTDDIIEFLEEAGVAEKDIKTSGYNVYPRYEYDRRPCTEFSCPPSEQRLVGYEVSHTITVTIRDLDMTGTLLSGAGERGATNISSLSFEVDEEKNPLREARKIAIDDAKEQAKKLAKDLGVRLVRIVDFQENVNTPYPTYFEMARDSSEELKAVNAPTIPTGENTYTSNVRIIYEIR